MDMLLFKTCLTFLVSTLRIRKRSCQFVVSIGLVKNDIDFVEANFDCGVALSVGVERFVSYGFSLSFLF